MWSALERHNAILGEAIRAHDGYHFKTIGDAFQAAFADPAAAVAASVDAQRALDAEPWPETGPIRVRMALHRGPAEPAPTGDYLAPSLNRLGHAPVGRVRRASAPLVGNARDGWPSGFRTA